MGSSAIFRSFVVLTVVLVAVLSIAMWNRPGAGNAAQGSTDISKTEQPSNTPVREAFAKLPLSFEVNNGQDNPQVKFLTRGSGYNIFLTSDEAVLSLSKPGKDRLRQSAMSLRKTEKPPTAREHAVVRMRLVGGNPSPQVRGLDELPVRTNYFIGNDPSKWRSVASYAKVEYQSVYPDIDLVYYGNQRQLEYDFVVAPGGDPGAIKLAFTGARSLRIDGEGNLTLRSSGGELCMHKPAVYQEVSGKRRTIEGRYAIRNRTVGFEVADYDPGKPLVIDPVLAYSTYIGGVEADSGEDIAVDSSGNAYVTGTTFSESFPLVNNYPSPLEGLYTVFVLKLNPAGNALLYSTHLAGSDGGLTTGEAIAVDSSGRAYVTGNTGSANFPTKNAYQLDQPDSDAFVAKLDTNTSGSASLLYSTYLGGSSIEHGLGIAADSSGRAYVTGYTRSSNFPTLNAFQSYQGGEDVFVTKLDTNASGAASLLSSTYIGGVSEPIGDERGQDIAADSSGNVYVTGYTTSLNFPMKNAYQTSILHVQDAFVTKLNTNVSGAASLLYSTYLGGARDNNGFGGVEAGYGIAVDASGIAYVTGYTTSFNFPTKNAYQSSHRNVGYPDVFITKLDTYSCGANSLLYSTFLGGSGPYNNTEIGFGIAADSLGNAYVTGYTSSPDFPTRNSLQAYQNVSCGIDPCADVFATKLNTNVAGAAGLVYSTFLGGAAHDRGLGIAVDSSGNAYVTGQAGPNFPTTPGAYQTGLNGGVFADAFVTKISDPASAPPPDADGDGVVDANDNCPGTPAGTTVDVNGCPVSCVVAPAGMVGWWPGDGNANDIKGSNHGTLQNGATFGTGKVGQAFSFDGVDDFVSAPFTQTGPFTVDFWAKANTGCQPAFFALLSSASPANLPENTFQIDFDGAGNYRLRAGAATPLHLTIGQASINFKHIAVTYDGSVIRTYLNGQLSNSGIWTGAALTFTTLRIGMNRGDGGPFNGLIDEVEIFNRPLAQSEIQSIYNAGSAGKCRNQAPVAMCRNVSVFADASCSANASIDNGSSDPDGDTFTLTQTPPGPYPLGATPVTLMVTDSKGATSSCSATVTVTDSAPPTITAPPAVMVSTGAGATACGVVVSEAELGSAIVSDNCGSAMMTRSGVPAGNFFPVGVTYITYTANDGRGNTATATQTVTVTDNTPPTITAPSNVNLSTGAGATACNIFISDATLGAASANDNCTVGMTRGGVPAGNVFPIGVTTITYTATDGAGNTATATQIVTVTDNTPPTITAPPAVNVATGAGATACGAFVSDAVLGVGTASDNCTVSMMRGGVPAGNVFPIGVTTITYTATDGAGNTATATQIVTVTDNTPPTITAPPAVNVATGAGATSCGAFVSDAVLGVGTASDNCTVSMTRSGVPPGNVFPVGMTTITYTATDGAGNTVTATQQVIVIDNTPPMITTCATNKTFSTNGGSQIALPSLIGEVTAADNCSAASALTITQSPAAGAMIGVGNTIVTLTVKDAAGNMSTCAATLTVGQFLLKDFVAFSQEFTWLRANTKVHTGNVGANTSLPDSNGGVDDKEEIQIGERVQMLQAGSSVVGDTVWLRANSQVYNVFFNELNAPNAGILGNQITPASLPVLTLPALPAITPGTQDIEVQTNQTLTLAPGSYRKITVKTKGTLILTGGVYQVSSLDIRQEAKILFTGPTEVWVKNEMDTDAKTFIGPDASAPMLNASQIIFYVGGTDDQGRAHDGDENLTPTVVQIGERNTVLANIYAPNGTVWLKANTNATGAFIGKQARIGERVELWLASAFQ